MSRSLPDIVRISSPSDVVAAVAQLLGFVPTESVAALCMRGPRRQLGLAMRFDLDVDDVEGLVASIDGRVCREAPDGVLFVVFTSVVPSDRVLPHRDLIDRLHDVLGDLVVDVFLVAGDRLWSYLCLDPGCCPTAGRPLDRQSPGALALASAYALAGQGVLPDREAVVRSVAYAGDAEASYAMTVMISAARRRYAGHSLTERRLAVRQLLSRLSTASHDPRASVGDEAAAELTALCDDVVVRDEVLIRCRKPRRRRTIMRLLLDIARRVPSPHDASVCASLAWAAYAAGDGVVANVALDRALRSDPAYSLALLIRDALQRQVPPWVLEDVMAGAARDLQGRSAAG